MSSAGVTAGTPASAQPEPRSTYVARVIRSTMAGAGARIGIAWILLLTFFAVFAPFLANSHPYLMKMGGTWSSPLLRHLTPADVALPILAGIAVWLLMMRRVRAGRRWLILLVAVLAVSTGSALFVSPPRAIVYDRYRDLLATGQIERAIFAPIPFSPSDRLRDQVQMVHPTAPTSVHWLGTEQTGADVASKMIHASRIAMAVGFIATGIAMFIGVIVGGVMGFFSGIVDLVGMRFVEIVAAIPTFFLLLSFVAFFPRNLYIMMVIIGVTGWVGYARFIRAEFLKLRQQDFVQAAIACGLPLRSILFRHMLPNGVAPVLVEASFGVAAAILYESTLSFLGLGLVDEPSWGQMLEQAAGSGGGFHWWIATFPGLAIFLTVFAYNLVGEALRDAIDPHLARSA